MKWWCWCAVVIVGSPCSLVAQDDKAPEKILQAKGTLNDDDPPDAKLKKPHKVHEVKLQAGKYYRIDMASGDFDSYLRLENPSGAQVAADDDSGGFPHARIIHKAEADGVFRIIATTFKGVGAYQLSVSPAGAVDVLQARAMKIFALPPAEQAEVLNEFRKHLTARGVNADQQDAQLALNVALAMERFSPPEAAADAFTDFSKVLITAKDEKVAKLGQTLAGAARRMKLPGNPIKVAGVTSDGKAFDWAPYKGKVVLVDFWATWCGPCLQELPNIQKNYADYKEKGFEVIGISLDQNRDALDNFLAKRKLPWATLVDKDAKESLAEYYGIFAIPLAILVDAEGRVVSLNARGAELGRQLEKLLK